MMKRFAATICALLLAVSVNAQDCVEADPPMGQPTLRGMRPAAFNAMPLPLTEGNPDFEMCTYAPDPVPMGAMTWLAIYFSPGPLVKMPNRWNFCFGERPLLPPLGNFNQVVLVFGGFTDASGHGEPVPVPVHAIESGLSFRVNTIGFTLDGTACVFVTDGVTVKT